MGLTPFHIAVQVRDIPEARHFYKVILGCEEGRSDTNWVDFSLYGHQFVCHLNPELGREERLRRTSIPWMAMTCRFHIAESCWK